MQPFFCIFPLSAKPPYRFRQNGQNPLDLCCRRIPAQGQPQRRAAPPVQQAHCPQHMALFIGPGGTGRSGGGGDPLHIQQRQQLVGGHAFKKETDDPRQSLRFMAGEPAIGNAGENAVDQPIRQGFEPRLLRFHSLVLFQKSCRHTDRAGHILGAGPAVLLLLAAGEEGRNGGSFADIDGADAPGTVELMGGDGQQILRR